MEPKKTPVLEAVGLTKQYENREGPVPALSGIDLTLREGEFLSLVGPSGCGKSTLLNLLAGLDEPSSGSIQLKGDDSLLRLGRIGYMPQRDLLMPWRSILDNAILGLETGGMPKEEARQRARRLFPRFGLEGFENRWPFELSDGMKQRAALLRTFLMDREVTLLDEPFGSLDSLSRASLQQWLSDYWQENRRAILLVTHDLDEALFLSDRVCVMSPRPGRLIFQTEVPLPRPRDYKSAVTDRAFVESKEQLLNYLRLR